MRMTTENNDPERASRGRSRALSFLSAGAKGSVDFLAQVGRALTTFSFQLIKKPMKGLFPPIGVVAILTLAVLTVGTPRGITYAPFYIFLAMSIVAGALIWTVPRETFQHIFPNIFGWLPVVVGVASWPYWYWYCTFAPPRVPNVGFFETAAQVLPVLLLATVIDVRRTQELKSGQLVLPIIAVFLGELDALDAIAFSSADATPSAFAVVAASLVTSIAALILAVLADILRSDTQDSSARARRSTKDE